MKIRIVLSIVSIFIGGCVTAPQTPIDLSKDTLTPNSGRVGVAMTALPKVDTHIVGAGCLLCILAANAANSTLTTHAQTLPYEDLPKLKDNISDLLRKRGANAIVIGESIDMESLSDYATDGPNIARKNYAPLKQKYQIDKLLLINVKALGFYRTYSSYFPTSDPKGVFQGTGFIVNLNNNSYEWYLPVDFTKSSDGTWDEPPNFPGLTNAYFQALELGKDSFLKPFKN